MSCENHIIGVCAGTNIISFDEPAVEKFLSNLKIFTTSKKQVNHPGFMILIKYCTECGAEIDYKKTKSQWDELIETSITRLKE
jgi:ribosomal protein L33